MKITAGKKVYYVKEGKGRTGFQLKRLQVMKTTESITILGDPRNEYWWQPHMGIYLATEHASRRCAPTKKGAITAFAKEVIADISLDKKNIKNIQKAIMKKESLLHRIQAVNKPCSA